MGIISGMTGFASVKKSSPLADVEMEAISRNSKYLDIRVSGQIPFLEIEKCVIDAVKASGICRGSIKIYVRVKMKAVSYNVLINEALLDSLKKNLKKIGLGLSANLSFEDLSSVPDLVQFYPKKTRELLDIFEQAAYSLLHKLKKEREKEGLAMARVLQSLIKKAGNARRQIELRLSFLKKKGKLIIAQDTGVDGEKDIFEEVKRLKMVLNMMKEALSSKDGPKGRDLDFICQEALRESNTILAKIKDPSITKHALSLKTLIDRMREIVQNIE